MKFKATVTFTFEATNMAEAAAKIERATQDAKTTYGTEGIGYSAQAKVHRLEEIAVVEVATPEFGQGGVE